MGFPEPILKIYPDTLLFLRVLIIALTTSSMCTKSLNCNPSEQLKFLFLIAFLMVIGITLFASCPGSYTKYNL